MNKAIKPNVFTGLGDMLAGGFDPLLTSDENEVMIDLEQIEISPQVREEFENDEHSLADLGRSLRKRQLQAIIVRPVDDGLKYRLVAGERRVRAAKLEGLTQLRGRVMRMTDDEAEDAQLAENIHRKNLTQIEEAKKIQRDLDQLGSVEAVLARHQKSHAWLSKMMSLLNLPEQAKRLVSENVSADIEVINTVKTIERESPTAARALVDELKQSRGKANARERAAAVKAQVKPPRPKKQAAEAKDTLNEVMVILGGAYDAMQKVAPDTVLGGLTPGARELVENWLRPFHDLGKATAPKELSGTAVQKIWFGSVSGVATAFALVAFLNGFCKAKFSLADVFAVVRRRQAR